MEKEIVFMLRGIFRGVKLLKQENLELEQLKKEIDEEIKSLSKLGIEEKNCKNKDIKSMIQHYLNLTDKMEERRTHIYNFTLQYLIICSTGAGLLFSQRNRIDDIIFYPIMVVLIIQIMFSIAIIIFHERQSAFRYPFLYLDEYGNKWKWFYYGNKSVPKIKTMPVRPSKRPDQTTIPYLEGLKEFIQNYKNEKIDEELSDNIQQLYLLLVHNYYKNQFHLQLTRIRLWSLIVTFVAFVIAIAIIFIILKYVN
jgi:hypothetical protein